jgi:hypothetical protein
LAPIESQSAGETFPENRSTLIKKDAAAALAAHQAQFLLKKLETRKEEHQVPYVASISQPNQITF